MGRGDEPVTRPDVRPRSPPAADSGLYQLVIWLRKDQVGRVGGLGRFLFPMGYYVYTGSARRRLESRIARHLRKKKRVRWHIDYLLKRGKIIEIKRYANSNLTECGLNGRTEELPGSRVIAPRFGSSDCRCLTHLLYFRRTPSHKLGEPAQL